MQLGQGAGQILVLAGPAQRVAGGQHNLIRYRPLRLGDEGTDVAALNVHVSDAGQPGVLALQHRRSVGNLDRGDLAQRHHGAGRRDDGQRLQLLQRVAYHLRIAQVDRIALQPFHGLGDVHPADGNVDDLLHVADAQSQPSSGQAVDGNVHIAAAGHPFGINRSSARNGADDLFQALAHLLDRRRIGARDLDAERRLDAGRQHVDAVLDRHHPRVAQAGQFDDAVQLGDQISRGQARPPFRTRFQLNRCLDHAQRCRIGGGLRSPDLAEHPLYLGNGSNQLVGLLQDFRRLADSDGGKGRRHVQQIALVQIGHEFDAQAVQRPPAGQRQ